MRLTPAAIAALTAATVLHSKWPQGNHDRPLRDRGHCSPAHLPDLIVAITLGSPSSATRPFAIEVSIRRRSTSAPSSSPPATSWCRLKLATLNRRFRPPGAVCFSASISYLSSVAGYASPSHDAYADDPLVLCRRWRRLRAAKLLFVVFLGSARQATAALPRTDLD